MDRIVLLESFIKDDPNDPFNYYGLALEYQKLNHTKCDEYFEILLEKFPEYLPTYYTAAKHWEENRPDLATETYEKGIALAQKQQNLKTLNELKNALLNFSFDD